MSKKWLIPVLVAGGIIYWIATKANTANQISYYIHHVKLNKSNTNAFRSELLVTLRINNPSSNSLKFNSFSGTISIDNQVLTTIQYSGFNQGIYIAPKTTTDITVPVVINHFNVLSNLSNIIKLIANGTMEQPLTIAAELVAGQFTIPIHQQIKLSSKIGSIGSTSINKYKYTYPSVIGL
jgi:LEA14-like dessication related protein